jgi:hypothetical protein
MKKVLAALLLMAVPALAQDGQHKAANFNYKYDVASATTTYCTMSGVGGDPFATSISGPGQVSTAGSVVTVDGTVGQDAFRNVEIGDLFSVRLSNGNTENRVVVTNADDDTITVDTAIDLPGNVWTYKTSTCGTTAADGWISVAGYSIVQLGFQYDAGDVTAASMTMECRSGALEAAPVRVYPGVGSDCGDGTLNGAVCEFTVVGSVIAFKIANNAFSACRVGVAWVTADGGTRDELTATLDVGR